MTAKILMTGILFARPEKRVLKDGALCVTAVLKSRKGNHARLWHIAAFRETAKETLLRLTEGDAVAVQGLIGAESYDSSGETRFSFGVIAERALGLHGPCETLAREDQAATRAQCIRVPAAGCSPAPPPVVGEGGH